MNNYSEQKLAGALKISRSEYADLEAGTKQVNFRHAKRLARLYNTIARYFYDEPKVLQNFTVCGDKAALRLAQYRYEKLMEWYWRLAHEKMRELNELSGTLKRMKKAWEREDAFYRELNTSDHHKTK